MVRQLTTRAQVSGYRFLLRRQEHSLVRHDVAMLHDPMRAQRSALVVGMVIALVVLGGFGVYGLVRPSGRVSDAVILVGKDSGALYVRRDQTLHPVLNLASARLLVGRADQPRSVAESVLASYRRGPLLGIPGAPTALPAPVDPSVSAWTICDRSAGPTSDPVLEATTLIAGAAPAGTDDATQPAALVRAGTGVYLLYQLRTGASWRPVRARVDVTSVPVTRALGIENVVPRPVSSATLQSLPRVPDIAVPLVAGAGGPGVLGTALPAGSVVKTSDASGRVSFHVVLVNGVQTVSRVVADMMLLSGAGAPEVTAVRAGDLVGVPTRSDLDVADYPQTQPQLVDAVAAPVICHAWQRAGEDRVAHSELRFASQLSAEPVALLGADGAGPALDEFVMRPGTGVYLQATGIEPGSTLQSGRYFVSDVGVRFAIADAESAAALGVGERPLWAPWALLSLLPAGPALSKPQALVAHAGVPPDTEGVVVDAEE